MGPHWTGGIPRGEQHQGLILPSLQRLTAEQHMDYSSEGLRDQPRQHCPQHRWQILARSEQEALGHPSPSAAGAGATLPCPFPCIPALIPSHTLTSPLHVLGSCK